MCQCFRKILAIIILVLRTMTLLTGLLKLDSSGYFSSWWMKLKKRKFRILRRNKFFFTFGLFVNSGCDCVDNLWIVFLGGAVAVRTVGTWISSTYQSDEHSNNDNNSPRSSWSESGSFSALFTGWISFTPDTWLDSWLASSFFKSLNIG